MPCFTIHHHHIRPLLSSIRTPLLLHLPLYFFYGSVVVQFVLETRQDYPRTTEQYRHLKWVVTKVGGPIFRPPPAHKTIHVILNAQTDIWMARCNG